MSRKYRTHSPDFKPKAALARIKGDETLSEDARMRIVYSDKKPPKLMELIDMPKR